MDYCDSGLAHDTEFCYAVSEINSDGSESAQSDPDCAKTWPGPPAEVDFTLTPDVPDNSINISWDFPAGHVVATDCVETQLTGDSTGWTCEQNAGYSWECSTSYDDDELSVC